METTDYRITRDESERIMGELRKVFDVVRILKEIEVGGKTCIEGSNPLCECFAFWKKDKKCEHCISSDTLVDKQDRAKLEFCDNSCFQVFCKYYEIDGKPCIMELIKKLDDNTFIDPKGYSHLMSKFSSFNDRFYKDAITGAFNRLYFEEKIKLNTEECGVALMDIDDFKSCNDIYGHKAGDEVLRTVVKCITQFTRADDAVIRFGGDEILIVLPGINATSFENKLELICKTIHSAIIPNYGRIQASVSIGAVITDGKETIESVTVRADKLMYQAKKTRNTVVCEWSTMHDEQKENFASAVEKQSILIIDDSEMNRELLKAILEDDYNIYDAENGKVGVSLIEKYRQNLSLILLDLVMPEMDGFEVLNYLNQKQILDTLPVIIISSDTGNDSIKRTYELGASDYIRRPFDAEVVRKRVSNIIKLYLKQRKLQTEIRKQMEDNEKISNMMTDILSHIVEYRNGESGPHVKHVEQITSVILEELEKLTKQYPLTEDDKKMITEASALHDIGKIGIDEKILNKPGKLTNEEFEIMKSHTLIGASIIEQMDIYKDEPFVKYIYQICRWHHEKWDGRGYPDGLKGDDIPIAAQVVSIADVYDALTNQRAYKPAYSHEKAIQMILNGECGKFNPLILKCLENAGNKVQSIETTELKK